MVVTTGEQESERQWQQKVNSPTVANGIKKHFFGWNGKKGFIIKH